jgi:hypothetical protein
VLLWLQTVKCTIHSAANDTAQLQNIYSTLADADVDVDAAPQVCAGNVAWLLDMASYLEVQPLQEACCEVCGAGYRLTFCLTF